MHLPLSLIVLETQSDHNFLFEIPPVDGTIYNSSYEVNILLHYAQCRLDKGKPSKGERDGKGPKQAAA